MCAPIRNYYEYDRSATISCPACGWSGVCAENEEPFSELLDIRCASCDKMLLIVPYPTHTDTRKAAAAGNRQALGNIKLVEEREAFFARAEEHALTSDTRLPELEGDDLVITWDFEGHEGDEAQDSWTILSHGDQEIWREVAFYEGIDRFEEILWMLREIYGPRMAELRPTEASLTYLLGDDMWASGRVDSLNEELATLRTPQENCGIIDVEDAEGPPDDPERQAKELGSAIEQMGPIDCPCGWEGDATKARSNGKGRERDVFCPDCRRPLFRVSLDE